MRMLLRIAFILSLLPVAALAQEAVVRSGEHSGFTRLVTPIPRGATWDVQQIDRTVNFRVNGFESGFDVSRVFDLIPRDRIAEITTRPDGLEVTLGCDCRVAASLTQERFAVIDVTSPGVTSAVPFVAMTTAEQSTPQETLSQKMALQETPADEIPSAVSALPALSQRSPEARSLPALARTPLAPQERSTLADVQQRLAEELGVAATRGLIEPLPGESLPTFRRPQIDPSALRTALPEQIETAPNALGVEPASNMRITSSMDIPGLSMQSGQDQSLSGFSCPSNQRLDVNGWSDDRPFHTQMAEARRKLFGELDRLDKETALALAKLYLHFGFGAEAAQVLRLDQELAQKQTLLLDIATILERGFAPQDSVLLSLLDCKTDAALWAILAHETLDVAFSIDAKPALLALNKLPSHLRKFLAPALSRKLLSHGDSKAAATALRSVERLPTPLPPVAKLAQAELEIDEGALLEGKDTLEEIIDGNSAESPEALVALVDTRLEAGLPISPETAGLIEAYAKEMKSTELGPDLRRAHVLALAKSGQFDRAFDQSAELGGNDQTDAALELRMRLIRELTATAGDVVFLDHVFRLSDDDIDRLPLRPKLSLATRLLELGFAERAQQVIVTVAERPLNEQRQMLAARIAIALSKPQLAKAALGDLSGAEVASLLAEANRMSGEYARASELFRQTDRMEAAAQAAWLSEEPLTEQLGNNPLFGPTINLTQSELTPSTQITGMIARSQAALDESEAARQTLRNLLTAPDLEISSPPQTE